MKVAVWVASVLLLGMLVKMAGCSTHVHRASVSGTTSVHATPPEPRDAYNTWRLPRQACGQLPYRGTVEEMSSVLQRMGGYGMIFRGEGVLLFYKYRNNLDGSKEAMKFWPDKFPVRTSRGVEALYVAASPDSRVDGKYYNHLSCVGGHLDCVPANPGAISVVTYHQPKPGDDGMGVNWELVTPWLDQEKNSATKPVETMTVADQKDLKVGETVVTITLPDNKVRTFALEGFSDWGLEALTLAIRVPMVDAERFRLGDELPLTVNGRRYIGVLVARSETEGPVGTKVLTIKVRTE